MKVHHLLITVLMLIVSACVPQEALTQTAIAQTQSYKNDMSTSVAETSTAVAPTTTQTPPPPTSTNTPTPSNTPIPSPTPSGEFEFFDVSIEQINEGEIAVSFGYQIKKDTKIEKVSIGAWPVGCDNLIRDMLLKPAKPNGFYSGRIEKDNALVVLLNTQGTCNAKSLQIFLFIPMEGHIYEATFEIPFTLKK